MIRIPFAALCAASLLLAGARPASGQARESAALSRRVDALLARMTLEEKVGEMTQLTIQAVAPRMAQRPRACSSTRPSSRRRWSGGTWARS